MSQGVLQQVREGPRGPARGEAGAEPGEGQLRAAGADPGVAAQEGRREAVQVEGELAKFG